MDFNAFAHSRDLLCLSGVFSGLAAGCIFRYFRRSISRQSRSRSIALSLLFFSGTIAALAAAVIVSLGGVFRDRAVIIAALLCIPVFALAVRFPRSVAYPLILAGGLAAVWLGYTFLRFPLVQTGAVPLAAISAVNENRYIISFGDRAEIPALQITGDLSGLRFSAAFISFKPFFPLIGGTVRGVITEIDQGNETLYADTSIRSALALNLRNVSAAAPFETIPPGTELGVQYDGVSLSIDAR
jgi:hypothetical protein